MTSRVKMKQIKIDPDPYQPFRLAQGYRVGELLFISGQAAIGGNGQLVGIGNFRRPDLGDFAVYPIQKSAGDRCAETVFR